MKILRPSVIFSWCFISLVFFGFGSAAENPLVVPSVSNPSLSGLFDGFIKYFKGIEERTEKLEKSIEEMKEQMKSLSKTVEEVKTRGLSLNQGKNNFQPPKEKGESSLPDLKLIRSCSDASAAENGQYFQIFEYSNPNNDPKIRDAVCPFIMEEGGWTILQKRVAGPKEEFNRNWNEYVKGFGTVDGNFWLGLENIRNLTKDGDQELQIQVEDFDGNKAHAKYSWFTISDASDFYRLSIGGYSGDAGNALIRFDDTKGSNGMRFSTKDKDNDKSKTDCASWYRSGWWFNECFGANLNGVYREKGEDSEKWRGIYWLTWNGDDNASSLAKTKMMIRKKI